MRRRSGSVTLLMALALGACEESGARSQQTDSSVGGAPRTTPVERFADARAALLRGDTLAAATLLRRLAESAASLERDSAQALVALLDSALAAGRARAKQDREAAALADKWGYDRDTDAMTSKVTYSARIRSENSVNFDFPYQGEQHATLMLRVHPTYGRDVIFRIEKGQLPCSSYDGCSVRVRFDEQPPQRWHANPAASDASEILFLGSYDSFVAKLRRANVVRVQPTVYQEGEPVFEFHVGGFDYARFMDRPVKKP